MSVESVLVAMTAIGGIIANLGILALNLKLYTEILKEKSQRERHGS